MKLQLLEYLETDREQIEGEEYEFVHDRLLTELKPIKTLSILINEQFYAEAIFLINDEFYSAMFGLNSSKDGPDWIERTKRVFH